MKSPPDKAGFSVSAVRISHPQRTATLILIDIGKKAGFALPPVISVLAAAFPFVLACSCQTPRSLVNWCTAIVSVWPTHLPDPSCSRHGVHLFLVDT
ncbi:hypothetical protein KUU00_13790, partial [Pseudomonas aeruginosa]|nr:hypothetical protein [Pseudomonas aeruginosa]MBV5957490.1 hypothetical protein [Pseudomonas aeruginosa]